MAYALKSHARPVTLRVRSRGFPVAGFRILRLDYDLTPASHVARIATVGGTRAARNAGPSTAS